jgi:hypothetical protein
VREFVDALCGLIAGRMDQSVRSFRKTKHGAVLPRCVCVAYLGLVRRLVVVGQQRRLARWGHWPFPGERKKRLRWFSFWFSFGFTFSEPATPSTPPAAPHTFGALEHTEQCRWPLAGASKEAGRRIDRLHHDIMTFKSFKALPQRDSSISILE